MDLAVGRILQLTASHRRTTGSRPQKGIIYYGVSPNRQNPFAGAFHDAIFNTFRRSRNQVLFWAPPVILYYLAASWALEKYVNDGEIQPHVLRTEARWF